MTHLRGTRSAFYHLSYDLRGGRLKAHAPGLVFFLVLFVLPGLAEWIAEVVA